MSGHKNRTDGRQNVIEHGHYIGNEQRSFVSILLSSNGGLNHSGNSKQLIRLVFGETLVLLILTNFCFDFYLSEMLHFDFALLCCYFLDFALLRFCFAFVLDCLVFALL